MKKVILVFGGKSAEHEVSVNSARNIAAAMDKSLFELIPVGISVQGTWYRFSGLDGFKNLKSINDIHPPSGAEPAALIFQNGRAQLMNLKTHESENIDCAFPINHGTYGEDGCIQGYFQMMNLPFVGCDVLSSSVSMNKDYMKRVLSYAGIPNAKYMVLTKHELPNYHKVIATLGSPFFIKPANMGSSVGVHKIKSEADFNSMVQESFLYDHVVLAEEFVEGREIECSVMGTKTGASTSVCGEIIPQHEFYSYDAKYLDDNGALLKIPADISPETMTKMQDMAKRVFRAMNCEGFARIDFFMKKNGEIYVNELNTLPGFTKISMYPKMWESSGIPYTQLITKLIDLAMTKFKNDRELKTSFLDFQDDHT